MKISKDIKDLNNESSWDDLAMPYQSASKEYQEIKPSLRDEHPRPLSSLGPVLNRGL